MKHAKQWLCMFFSLFITASLFSVPVHAAEVYKEHKITPFSGTEKLVEYEYTESSVTFAVPSKWKTGTVNDTEVFYPDSSNKNEYLDISLLEGDPDLKSFSEKNEITSWISYLTETEPELTETAVSGITTDYYSLGNHYFSRTALTRSFGTGKDAKKQKEIVYCLPIDKDNLLILTVVLQNNVVQKNLAEEEAILLTVKDKGTYIFETYLNSLSSAAGVTRQSSAANKTESVSAGTAAAASAVTASENTVPAAPAMTYVLNTNSMKFHMPGCASAKQIKASNRRDVSMTRDEIIAMGYVPCKRCNP